MGVRGLKYHCLRSEGCFERVDLVDVATFRDSIDLLVDFDSFHYSLLEHVSKGTSEGLQFPGGEYVAH